MQHDVCPSCSEPWLTWRATTGPEGYRIGESGAEWDRLRSLQQGVCQAFERELMRREKGDSPPCKWRQPPGRPPPPSGLDRLLVGVAPGGASRGGEALPPRRAYDRRRMAATTSKRTTAPTMATMIMPPIPEPTLTPSTSKSQPPRKAPRIPTTIDSTRPRLTLRTNQSATIPAIPPITIQSTSVSTDICPPLTKGCSPERRLRLVALAHRRHRRSGEHLPPGRAGPQGPTPLACLRAP